MYLQPLRMRRITWPLRRGKFSPHIWNPRPRFAYSLYNFYGTTMTFKGCLLLALLVWKLFSVDHSRTVVRECLRATIKVNGKGQTLTPSPLNPLTDPHQNLRRYYIGDIYHRAPCKILFRSDEGFRFRAWATSRIIVYSSIFWFYPWPAAKTPPPTSTQNTPKDAVLRTDVPFGVAKPKFNIYTPFVRQNRHFGARFGRYLEIIGQKPALTLEVLRVNGPWTSS